MRLLLTRPRPQSEALALDLVGTGHGCLIDPVMVVEPTGEPLPDPVEFQALIVTSGNGADALMAATPRRDLDILCVGTATWSKLAAAGFVNAAIAGGNQAQLIETIRRGRQPQDGPLLHVSGADQTGDLAGDLARNGFVVEPAVLYKARAADALTPETTHALRRDGIDGVLLFSPRTARIFARLVGQAGLGGAFERIEAFCLSDPVAGAAAPLPWRAVHVAARPTRKDILALLPDP